MKLWRIIPLLILVGVLGASAFGFATELQLKQNALTTGAGKVVRCDTNVQIYWNTEWNPTAKRLNIKSVIVAGISDGCLGKAYRIVITEKDNDVIKILKGTFTAAHLGYPNLKYEFAKADQFAAGSVNGIAISFTDP